MDDATRAILDGPFRDSPLHYKLVGRDVVPCKFSEWCEEFESLRRFRFQTWIGTRHDGFNVSTIFLGLDHRFGGGGPPIVFESMIFHGYEWSAFLKGTFHNSVWQDRYCTYDDAELGHWRAVGMARRAWTRSKRIGRARRRLEKPRFE